MTDEPKRTGLGVGFAVGCASFFASVAVATIVLGGLLFRWAASDSRELSLQVLGTGGFILVAAVATTVIAGVGLPRNAWVIVILVAVGAAFGVVMGDWMKDLVIASCTHGSGPQPGWCDSVQTQAEHVSHLLPHYMIAGGLLGLLATLAGTTRTAIVRSLRIGRSG